MKLVFLWKKCDKTIYFKAINWKILLYLFRHSLTYWCLISSSNIPPQSERKCLWIMSSELYFIIHPQFLLKLHYLWTTYSHFFDKMLKKILNTFFYIQQYFPTHDTTVCKFPHLFFAVVVVDLILLYIFYSLLLI